MTRNDIVRIANGDTSLLFAYFLNKKSDIQFEVFQYYFMSNLEAVLASWEINSIFDINGRLIKYY